MHLATMSITGRRGNWNEEFQCDTTPDLDIVGIVRAAADNLLKVASNGQKKLRLRRRRRKGAAFASLGAGMTGSPAGEDA